MERLSNHLNLQPLSVRQFTMTVFIKSSSIFCLTNWFKKNVYQPNPFVFELNYNIKTVQIDNLLNKLNPELQYYHLEQISVLRLNNIINRFFSIKSFKQGEIYQIVGDRASPKRVKKKFICTLLFSDSVLKSHVFFSLQIAKFFLHLLQNLEQQLFISNEKSFLKQQIVFLYTIKINVVLLQFFIILC